MGPDPRRWSFGKKQPHNLQTQATFFIVLALPTRENALSPVVGFKGGPEEVVLHFVYGATDGTRQGDHKARTHGHRRGHHYCRAVRGMCVCVC